MKELKCPYCKKENFIPEIVFRHTERYGEGRKNFKCNCCRKVVSTYCMVQVIIQKAEKTNSESDW